ncbi:TPA: hypothetical protein DCL30_04855 [Candidatus Peribacteria bacterium]|nr:MAG: hypothetical protein A2529_04915 [Candidatus Peribacteria bacterium RIFOXYD2_FULL_58_15]HAI98832.1 hypothetical protein [Candidatus Peribacteria bacterium]HAS34046.1 hypothetical protein [Candidatus Peribacteria bacterium]
MFDPVDPRQSLPAMEHGILKYWKEEDIFKRSISNRSPEDSFSFYDGPPFATGLPHYGHLLAGTIKDVIPRYQTMRGKRVERRFGWDCHGLPVENLIEKEYKIASHKQIREMGIGAFNRLCAQSVQRFTKEWREVVERMGRWVDMDNDYRTMDPDYMESIWWVFSELHRKGLVYEGYKPMYICPRCATPLSNFEVAQGYRDRTDLSVIVTLPLKDDPKTALLAWTTTPWSLPGNMWLAIGRNIEYALVESEGKRYILARKLLDQVFKGKEFQIIGPVKPKDLTGKKYEPLFPYFVDKPSSKKRPKETYGDRVFKVVIYDDVEVSDAEGTGIVHATSCLGEDSYRIAVGEDVDVVWHLGIDGIFSGDVKDFAGMQAKPEGKDPQATDRAIIGKLKDRGRVFSSFSFTHSYPHCWRCDTPLLPYTTSSWFVKVEEIKEGLLKANAKTEWVPDHVRSGRFGKWLEGARDWAISRNRFWGTPLPIWRCSKSGEIEVISSRDELMTRSPQRFTKVTVLRHGESEGNLIPVYQGAVPGTSLTARGKKQAKETGRALAGAEISVIYASPLDRTQQTAKMIAEATNAPVITDDRLREVGFGSYEGKTVDFSDLSLVKARRAHKLQQSAPESIYHFPGMETWQDVQVRISSFLTEILPRHRGQHIVLVTHADPLLNIRHVFTKEDPVKLSHQPYPVYADPYTFFFDHTTQSQLDLHRETVDSIMWQATNGGTMERVSEVFDCWFESGSMPYAQSHYPFESEPAGSLPPGFPADFIAEGMDQTRGWFYTLMVLSTALFDQPAFQHCVVNGIVLAEDGKKMSKRLKNYPEPMELVEKHGADAVRFTLMSSSAVRGEDLRFSGKLVEESVRSVLLPLWNAYSFFVTYANAAKYEPVENRKHSAHPLDRWIRAEMQDLCNRMTEQLDRYDLSATCAELFETIDALTNWYIRLSRRRFAGKASIDAPDASYTSEMEADEEDRLSALSTLHDVLLTMSQLLAPFCPYISDAIYLNLVTQEHGSVHLTDWPDARKLTDAENKLLAKTRLLRLIVSLGHAVRSEKNMKARQPLKRAVIALPPAFASIALTDEDRSLLRQEMNVKELSFITDPGKLAQTVALVDARKVGPRLGARVQEIIAAGKRGEFDVQPDGMILIGEERLAPEEVQIAYRGKEGMDAAADRGVVVGLDTTVSTDLKLEGCVRDLIRAVQKMRKDSGLSFTDIIDLDVKGFDDIVGTCKALLEEETRSKLKANEGKPLTVELDGRKVTIRFQKQ